MDEKNTTSSQNINLGSSKRVSLVSVMNSNTVVAETKCKIMNDTKYLV